MPSSSATCGAELAAGAALDACAARWAPAGRALAAAGFGGLAVWQDAAEQGSSSVPVHTSSAVPLLDVAWDASGSRVLACGADGGVRAAEVASLASGGGGLEVVGRHGQAASCAARASSGALVTGGWDGVIKVWDGGKLSEVASATLPGGVGGKGAPKVLAMDAALSGEAPLVAVAASERRLLVYDLRALSKPLHDRASPLKMATRAVRLVGGEKLVVGSLEGRVAVDLLAEPDAEDRGAGKKYVSYAFKCHRVSAEEGAMDESEGTAVALGASGETISPVHALAAHPSQSRCVASGGGDGHAACWDVDAKRRLWLSGAYPAGVVGLDWAADGGCLAVVTSEAVEGGAANAGDSGRGRVYVRDMAASEYTPRPKKR